MNIGDYVRTKNGIAKIVNLCCGEDLWFDNDNVFDEEEKEVYKLNAPSICSNWAKDNILKSSPNIIDLIEVGDYVNGHKVIRKYEDRVVIYTINGIIVWFEYQIKSIVTKEQFESMEYKIGE